MKRILIISLFLFISASTISAEDIWSKLNLSHPGLEEVSACCSAGDYSAAAEALLAYYKSRTGFCTPEIPDPAVVVCADTYQKIADDALKHRFFVMNGYEVYYYGDDIDWKYWPIRDNELRWQLHRHKWFTPMGHAYRASGDEQYVKAWMHQYLDWIKKNPLVELDAIHFEMTEEDSHLTPEQENMRFAWRPLEVSTRVQDQICQFQLFLSSDEFTAEFLQSFIGNYYRHVDYLTHNLSSKGNHLLFQAQRLFYAGSFFPEFKEAEQWRKIGIETLNREILKQVYPDGGHWELDPHYHLASINIFCKALEMALLCGLRDEFPTPFNQRLEKMIEFYGNICYPDYQTPCFSDARLTDLDVVKRDWKNWSRLFPDNQYILWMATEGEEGAEPSYQSVGYPDSGFFVFRTSRDVDAVQMVVKAGPPGEWHCQPDNGTFELWYKGCQLFPDSGAYVYAGDEEVMRWRKLFRSTAFHNTVTLDGKDMEVTQSRTLLWQPEGRVQKLVTENHSYAGLTHKRTIEFIDGVRFIITDELSGDATGKVALHLHPGPDMMDQFKLKVNGPRDMVFRQEEGWVSYHYREKQPRPHLIWEVEKKSKKKVKLVTYIN